MMHHTTVLPPQDILAEVRKFISGAVRPSHSTNTQDVTRTALFLLKNVPAARDAVLEYFCNVFFVVVTKYVRLIETNQPIIIPEECIIAEIHTVLSSFINGNPEAWAPIISAWSLELLGKLSTDYAKRGNLPTKAGINDFLQQWMSCRATRTLIDITAQCLQCLMHSDTESCIKALLDTSVLHSPYFDWVVAHVGSCFPNTVITRVLSCGLKDFCAVGYEHNIKNPKLNSVVGILGHLAGSHSQDIRRALLDLFKWSLVEDVNLDEDTKEQKLATVPFLLNLASLSQTLLKALTSDVLQTLKPDVIPRLALFAADWCKYFNNQPEALIDLTVHLTLGCEQGALQIINLLLDTSLNTSNVGYHSVNAAQNVKDICREILELMLQEIDLLLRTHGPQTAKVALLNSIKQDIPLLVPMLLNSNPLRVQTAVRLLCFLKSQSHNIVISMAAYMLVQAQTTFHLAALLRLITNNIVLFPVNKSEDILTGNGHFTQVLEQALREIHYKNIVEKEELRRLFQNLTILLKWEKSNKAAILQSKMITRAIRSNLHQISCLLSKTDDFDLATDIVILLDLLSTPEKDQMLYVELMLRLTRAFIHYFFLCIVQTDINMKQRGVKMVCHLLRDLTCYSPCARVLALREILGNSINNEQAKSFGAKEKFEPRFEEMLLLHQNHKQVTSTMLAQRHSSVFHAGVIGHGPRRPPPENSVDKEIIAVNKILLIDVIKACCSNQDSDRYPVNLDALMMVSLLLVELVSPDVMYNGLPWPDEEFTKVTIERDLQIRRKFKDVPLLWTLLELTAWYRPALAYSSVLLRGIAATVMANWNTKEGVSLVNIMALGQLLPPPLASIRDILPVLEPHQINTVMKECVWAYMREHVPSPALFTRTDGANIAWRDIDTSAPNARFTDTLRLVLLANIHTLGSLYSMLFYNENK
ncbi:integrator complex subunit 5 isoform X1 [Odontomachus brunneus]|uniref:integrator complex subunit 5 isoform X1 n=1 Tax=Odontomachus brunneus TaxID=486640 RepID=UPI0013F20A8A|nr:integrator complex subunit 5 isoform X1 [Odontomachus brunneus]XP_032683316.1 integrator complex subunit 5 isoform X1 [Odontomachus brunneus]